MDSENTHGCDPGSRQAEPRESLTSNVAGINPTHDDLSIRKKVSLQPSDIAVGPKDFGTTKRGHFARRHKRSGLSGYFVGLVAVPTDFVSLRHTKQFQEIASSLRASQ